MNWDLLIVGGGAAGLWAAGTAAARGKRVLVLEKNRKAGVKILMSGGTRCNITHHCGVTGILDAFGAQGRFLKHALHQLPPDMVVAEVNRLGVATKVEDSGKVFPVSDRALDVRDALVKRLGDAGAELRCGEGVSSIGRDKAWRIETTEGAHYEAEKLLICCGGLSYAGCGTTGDGYPWARQLGHNLLTTHPALTPVVSSATWAHELSGVTLPDALVRVLANGKRLKDPRAMSRGGFLWTHFGCSGPVPMNVSRWLTLPGDESTTALEVDLLPDLTEQDVSDSLMHLGSKSVGSYLNGLVPKRVAATLASQAGVQLTTTGAELPKKARQTLVIGLKRLTLPVAGTRGYAKAEVTAGGVDTSEVDAKTMQSKLVNDLFFAGEILNIDGPIGGFNFQAAFATGHLAALHV